MSLVCHRCLRILIDINFSTYSYEGLREVAVLVQIIVKVLKNIVVLVADNTECSPNIQTFSI
jgi:hypothetical protein